MPSTDDGARSAVAPSTDSTKGSLHRIHIVLEGRMTRGGPRMSLCVLMAATDESAVEVCDGLNVSSDPE